MNKGETFSIRAIYIVLSLNSLLPSILYIEYTNTEMRLTFI